MVRVSWIQVLLLVPRQDQRSSDVAPIVHSDLRIAIDSQSQSVDARLNLTERASLIERLQAF